MAVEIHQNRGDSTDLRFALQLSELRQEQIRAEGLVGKDAVPSGSTVLMASLQVGQDSWTHGKRLHRVVEAGSEVSASDSIPRSAPLSGVFQLGEFRSAATGDVSKVHCLEYDVTQDVQAWCDGQASLGWKLSPVSPAGDAVPRVARLLKHATELHVHYLAPTDRLELAWFMANCSDDGFRQPTVALRHAQEAAAALPDDAWLKTVIGAALFRSGDWDGAFEALSASIQLGKLADRSREIRRALILSIVHSQAGDRIKARKWLNQAELEAKSFRPAPAITTLHREAVEAVSETAEAKK